MQRITSRCAVSLEVECGQSVAIGVREPPRFRGLARGVRTPTGLITLQRREVEAKLAAARAARWGGEQIAPHTSPPQLPPPRLVGSPQHRGRLPLPRSHRHRHQRRLVVLCSPPVAGPCDAPPVALVPSLWLLSVWSGFCCHELVWGRRVNWGGGPLSKAVAGPRRAASRDAGYLDPYPLPTQLFFRGGMLQAGCCSPPASWRHSKKDAKAKRMSPARSTVSPSCSLFCPDRQQAWRPAAGAVGTVLYMRAWNAATGSQVSPMESGGRRPNRFRAVASVVDGRMACPHPHPPHSVVKGPVDEAPVWPRPVDSTTRTTVCTLRGDALAHALPTRRAVPPRQTLPRHTPPPPPPPLRARQGHAVTAAAALRLPSACSSSAAASRAALARAPRPCACTRRAAGVCASG